MLTLGLLALGVMPTNRVSLSYLKTVDFGFLHVMPTRYCPYKVCETIISSDF
jgi:hypothetical protein